MKDERSREKLLSFLEYLAVKGLMAKATIAARKAAAGKLLSILSDEEASDVTKLDLDDVMKRFSNLEGIKYTADSLRTYLSRTKSAIEDFSSYLENPLGFRPSVQTRDKRKQESKKGTAASSTIPQEVEVEKHSIQAPLSSSILPIPIRPDTTVFVQGLPYNLTEAEANKIANVIKAMATPA